MSDIASLASSVHSVLRAADMSRLAVGRLIAETVYGDSREAYESRKRKPLGLRGVAKSLRALDPDAPSVSALQKMIAAHFQEPLLDLSPDDASRLSWRARVEILREKDPGRKARFARGCLEKKWPSRELAARIAYAPVPGGPDPFTSDTPFRAPRVRAYTPAMGPRTKGERLLRKALLLCRELEDWKNAPDDDQEKVREVVTRMFQVSRRVRTALPASPQQGKEAGDAGFLRLPSPQEGRGAGGEGSPQSPAPSPKSILAERKRWLKKHGAVNLAWDGFDSRWR